MVLPLWVLKTIYFWILQEEMTGPLRYHHQAGHISIRQPD
jgi:hypothetical protein